MRGREENGWRIEKKDAHKGDETKEERSRGGRCWHEMVGKRLYLTHQRLNENQG